MTHLPVPPPAQFRKTVQASGPALDRVHQDSTQGLMASERKSARITQTRWHHSTLSCPLAEETRAPEQEGAYLPPLVRTRRGAWRPPRRLPGGG